MQRIIDEATINNAARETEMRVMSDAEAFNAELDRSLEDGGKVDRDTYIRFIGAYHYDAASTADWLRSKLRILQQRLGRGESIYLWDTSTGGQIECTTVQGLDDWISEHFSPIQL